jgi:hypothetical protein
MPESRKNDSVILEKLKILCNKIDALDNKCDVLARSLEESKVDSAVSKEKIENIIDKLSIAKDDYIACSSKNVSDHSKIHGRIDEISKNVNYDKGHNVWLKTIVDKAFLALLVAASLHYLSPLLGQ